MIHVEGDLNIDTYNDNPVNVIAQTNAQTNTSYHCQHSTSPKQPEHNSGECQPIYLNDKKGNKADLFRVILGLYETGFFQDPAGGKPTKKDVFAAFGQMLHEDFSEFEKNLSAMKNVNNDSPANSSIFDKLKSAVETYMSPKN